jgi:hypothetical protein
MVAFQLVRTGAIAFLLLAAAIPAGDACAARYGAVVIRNPSSVSIPFQFRLGNHPWEDYRVPAYRRLQIYFELERGRAPTPTIRFGYILDDDAVTSRSYSLAFYEVEYGRWSEGKPYRFNYYASGTRLELRAGKGTSGAVEVVNRSNRYMKMECDTVSCVNLLPGERGRDVVTAGMHTFHVSIYQGNWSGAPLLDHFYEAYEVPADGVLKLELNPTDQSATSTLSRE